MTVRFALSSYVCKETLERRGISTTTPSNLKTKGTHNYYVYILTNKNKTVLYTGVTNNLKERLYTHKNPEANSKAFTAKYKVHFLIYFEYFKNIVTAIAREKQIKGYRREKKDKLIASINPNYLFLDNEI